MGDNKCQIYLPELHATLNPSKTPLLPSRGLRELVVGGGCLLLGESVSGRSEATGGIRSLRQ